MVDLFKALVEVPRQSLAVQKAAPNPIVPIAPYAYGNIAGLATLGNEQVPYDLLLRAYRGTSYSCIEARAQAVGSVNFDAYRQGDNGKLAPLPLYHPLNLLLDNPNPHYCNTEIIGNLERWLCITGNAYLYIARDLVTDKPAQLWWLESNLVKIEKGDPRKGEPLIKGYRYGASASSSRVYPPRDIIHFRLENMRDPFYGASIMQAAWRTMQTDSEMEQAVYSWFLNGGLIAMYIKLENPPGDPNELESVRDDLRRQYTGARAAGRPMILGGDWGDPKTISQDGKSTMLLDHHATISLKIHNIFRVPRVITGDVQDFNRANSITAERIFYKNTIVPQARLIAQTLTRRLQSEYSDFPVVGFDNIIPLDKEELAAISVNFKNAKALSYNQILEFNNYPKSDNPDANKPIWQIEFEQQLALKDVAAHTPTGDTTNLSLQPPTHIVDIDPIRLNSLSENVMYSEDLRKVLQNGRAVHA